MMHGLHQYEKFGILRTFGREKPPRQLCWFEWTKMFAQMFASGNRQWYKSIDENGCRTELGSWEKGSW